ncbi:MAG: type II secretion system protein GspC [Deltaproteobacteria bacterium]|nr:type II secretion system protein GspC [Deltaproteobacteria bacterium]
MMATRLQTLVNLIAIALISFFAVELFYTIIGVQLDRSHTQNVVVPHQLAEKKRGKYSLDYFSAVIERNLFTSGEQVAQEIDEEEIENLEPTSLKIALLGTVVGSEQDSFAIIEEKGKKKQALYKVGDNVQSAIVKKILRGKVILNVQGRDKILTIEEEAASRRTREVARAEPIRQGKSIMVRRSEVEESLKNVHRLLSQARVRPHFSEGKPDGLAISHIKRRSIFEKLGLKNGDVIKGLDGNEIKSPDDVLQMYKKLTLGSEVAIEIERGGEEQIINYTFR